MSAIVMAVADSVYCIYQSQSVPPGLHLAAVGAVCGVKSLIGRRFD